MPFFSLSDNASHIGLQTTLLQYEGFPGGLEVKNMLVNAGDARNMNSISRLGRSPGGGNGH